MEPYEGREPYIFISYARKDAERVLPYLDALSGTGYRVWYDKGIKAGEHWTETLVEKVEACAVFCPLFSEAFNASRFCFEETEYAYRKDKPIVPAYLEEMKPDDLRPLYRLLGSRQDLRLYQFDSAARFTESLKGQQAFAPCKAPPEWNKVGEIQWRFADGVLSIAKNEDLPEWFLFPSSIPSYQFDPFNKCSTAPWASYGKKIISVEIADDIDEIGENAFYGCENLTEALIGKSVTVIGDFAFSRCYRLKDIHIPDSVIEIGESAFEYCHSLTDMCIPDNVIEIGDFAFFRCFRLTDIRIPDSVIAIGNGAFEGCYSLTDMRIPDSVVAIGNSAFEGCESLTNVLIPDSVTKIGESAFEYCNSLTNVRIPDGVTKIAIRAFGDCTSLMYAHIPDSVTEIDWKAFAGCKNLKSVEIPAGAKVDKYAFPEHTHVTRRPAP